MKIIVLNLFQNFILTSNLFIFLLVFLKFSKFNNGVGASPPPNVETSNLFVIIDSCDLFMFFIFPKGNGEFLGFSDTAKLLFETELNVSDKSVICSNMSEEKKCN